MIINLTPHDVTLIANAIFDPTIRKYRGGEIVVTIPSSGMVSAKSTPSPEMDPLVCDGVPIPTMGAPRWEGVDPLPEGGDYYIVSALYVSACRELGLPTDRLLTIGNTVVGEDGRTIRGTACLIRN